MTKHALGLALAAVLALSGIGIARENNYDDRETVEARLKVLSVLKAI